MNSGQASLSYNAASRGEGRGRSCEQRAGVTQLQYLVDRSDETIVVNSGQASLSYNRDRAAAKAVNVVNSGQASLSYNCLRRHGGLPLL